MGLFVLAFSAVDALAHNEIKPLFLMSLVFMHRIVHYCHTVPFYVGVQALNVVTVIIFQIIILLHKEVFIIRSKHLVYLPTELKD